MQLHDASPFRVHCFVYSVKCIPFTETNTILKSGMLLTNILGRCARSLGTSPSILGGRGLLVGLDSPFKCLLKAMQQASKCENQFPIQFSYLIYGNNLKRKYFRCGCAKIGFFNVIIVLAFNSTILIISIALPF